MEPVFASRHHVATTIADHRQGAHPEKHVALVGDDRLNRSDTGKTGLVEGEKLAARVKARDRLVVDTLMALGVPGDAAESDAEGVEHYVSEKTLNAFVRFMGSIASDK